MNNPLAKRQYLNVINDKGEYHMPKRFFVVTFFLTAALLILNCLPIHGESEIYDTVVRLHVLANSDSPEDQELKLKVRDGILAVSKPILKGCTTQDEAASRLEENRELLTRTALDIIRKEGYNYPVDIKLGRENYPAKTYENCAFPAGNYVSLQVLIGEGEGQNWWCVLFPPLCLSAATTKDSHADSNEDAFIAVGLTKEQYGIITETENAKYKIRFKILEAIESIFDR